MFENINYIELIGAGVAAMVVGFVWYSKTVFGKQWMKEVGITEAQAKAGSKNVLGMYAPMYIGAIVQAFVLSVLISVFGANDYMSAATVAFWAWLGFVTPVVMGSVLFERKSWTYFAITVGYQLANMIAMSAIIIAL